MKIPQNLPQFENEKALFIVSGIKEALFLLVHKGEIISQDNFRIVKETVAEEKEGFFIRGGRGKIFEMGAVFEPKKKKIRKEFLEKLKKHFKEIFDKEKIDSVYIFAPGHVLKSIKAQIPTSVQNKIKMAKKGNYTEYHPLKLIEMIVKEKEQKRIIPISEEAKKLLDKFKEAKRLFRK